MKQPSHYRYELMLFAAIMVIGQIVFAAMSHRFTTPRYEGRIYATTGVQHKQEDLHKLNEAAHYFGQTIIGWLKFPNFFSDLQKVIPLPQGSELSAHIQERQNIIFSLNSPTPVEAGTLKEIKDYIQTKIDQYNSVSQTKFVLTNLDYEQVEIKKSYTFGVFVTLLISFVLAVGIWFVRREFLK